MIPEGTNLLVLTISSLGHLDELQRQISIPLSGRWRQVSLYNRQVGMLDRPSLFVMGLISVVKASSSLWTSMPMNQHVYPLGLEPNICQGHGVTSKTMTYRGNTPPHKAQSHNGIPWWSECWCHGQVHKKPSYEFVWAPWGPECSPYLWLGWSNNHVTTTGWCSDSCLACPETKEIQVLGAPHVTVLKCSPGRQRWSQIIICSASQRPYNSSYRIICTFTCYKMQADFLVSKQITCIRHKTFTVMFLYIFCWVLMK